MEEETGISGVPVNSSKKRQNKRNIREKRRSTGVIILPPSKEDWEHGIDGSEETEELKAAAINAAANENITSEDYNQIITASEDPPDFKIGELLTHKRELEEAITLWQEAYNHISSELDNAKNDNFKLISENKNLKIECQRLMSLIQKKLHAK